MNDKLAERLLAEIMEWDEIKLTNERLDLQVLSSLKYDEYQQFYPGIRFMESLSLWLRQFTTIEERELAYAFMKRKVILISLSELNHLIRIAYPDFIEPFLIGQFSKDFDQVEKHCIMRIANKQEFRIFRRQCLFLGLSDGAKIDVLRRYSGLDHEQTLPSYSISIDKSKEFISKLETYLKEKKVKAEGSKFRIIFLLDDFSGSGTSFIRKEDGEYSGKIVKFFKHLQGIPKEHIPIEQKNSMICVVLYVCTRSAKERILKYGKEYFARHGIEFSMLVIQELNESIKLNEENLDPKFFSMIKKYYDNKIESKSYRMGKMDQPYLGFDEGGLPLVLYHNCPNNSLALLWFDPDRYQYRGLFPRIERFPAS